MERTVLGEEHSKKIGERQEWWGSGSNHYGNYSRRHRLEVNREQWAAGLLCAKPKRLIRGGSLTCRGFCHFAFLHFFSRQLCFTLIKSRWFISKKKRRRKSMSALSALPPRQSLTFINLSSGCISASVISTDLAALSGINGSQK